MKLFPSIFKFLASKRVHYLKMWTIPMSHFPQRQSMDLAFDTYLPPGDKEVNLPPVILLHGMMDSRKTWKHIAPQIAKHTGRKVYAVDARDHGESPWTGHFTFDILAHDVDHFLTHHNIPRALLVGHSMGGRTALTLALLKPEKVEKIVVEDMNLQNFRPSAASAMTQVLSLVKESLNAIPPGANETVAKQSILSFFKELMSDVEMPNSNILNMFPLKVDLSMIPLKGNNGEWSWQANLDAIQQFLTTDRIRQELKGVYMGDALFMYGTKSFFKVDKDPLIPKFFPKVVMLGFEGTSHLVHMEHPKRFVREVSNFINEYRDIKSKY